ncbi:acetyltransferase, GNAT family [Oesophagostomum dentatum]|uniref:aralkylamine N-acetyltransferase n=1 Tax=Oesophagostomum dentatum TaxID=61180 RepID=A0A0B1T2N3_OESDE|nr:acetyltransferase, GNAT family [Oesophagostomum dentatum]
MLNKFRFIPATKDHASEILEFLFTQFGVNEPISKSIKLDREGAASLFRDTAESGYTNDKYSTLAYDDDRLAGICLCSMSKSGSKDAPIPPEIDFKHHDFAQDILNGPYKQHKGNQIVILVHALEDSIKRILGTSSKMMKIDILSVHKDYMGKGLGKELTRRAIETAQAEGCDYVATAATASASQAIFSKVGFKVLYEIPYSDYRENGNPVFQNLHDGCKAGKAMALKLH